MAKKTDKAKNQIQKGDIFTPLDITQLGDDRDPCFGKEYNLSTDECKICGDSELCCIKFAAMMGKTRKELEAANNYKDLEVLVDKTTVNKSIRQLLRKGLEKKEIIQRIQAKYELDLKQARFLYREYINSKKFQ